MPDREKVISNLQGVYEYLRHFENTAKMGEWVADALALLKEQEKLLGDYEKISQVLFKIDKYFSIKELEWLVNEMDNGRIVVLQDNGHQIGGTTITETTIKIRRY